MIGASNASGSTEAREGGAGTGGEESTVQHQLTRAVCHPFANLIPVQGVPSFLTQTLVSQAPPMSLPSHHNAFVNFPIQSTSVPTPAYVGLYQPPDVVGGP